MNDESRSDTTESNAGRKKPGGITGKGFVKGDPRINRKGRPKSFDALRALAQQIAAETATDKGEPIVINGHIATVAEMILRDMMHGKQRKEFLEIAYGKVPDKHEITGEGGGPVAIEVKAFNYGTAIARIAPGSVDDSESPGGGEGHRNGPALGQEHDGG